MHSNRILRSSPDRVQKRTQPKRRSLRLAQVANETPQSNAYKRGGKRKRVYDQDDLTRTELPHEKGYLHRAPTPASGPEADSNNGQYGSNVRWEEYFRQWPPLYKQDESMSESRATKRSRSHSSYSQSVRDGSSPVAWTRQHEEMMQKAGLIMEDYEKHAKITADCQKLCNSLLKKQYPLPDGPSFTAERLAKVIDRVRLRNEARVVRDVLPVIVPSPELLHIDGYAHLEDISEAMNAEWTQCDTLCGPKPKPDFVVGISPSAFSNEEISKLKISHTSACPNIFPENMYLPFLICEVKGSDRPVREAERQAMHGASIAVRALIQLYRKTLSIDEINQKILVFSVAHDPSTVKIFGHFAKIDGDRITFFRHLLFSGDFTAADFPSNKWAKAYQIIRAIYESFYPNHLKRIKHALSKMRSPTLASFTSQLGLDGDSQDSAAESFSQDGFKKPSLPSVIKLQQENKNLRDQLLEVVRGQQDEAKRQREQQLEQLAQQKEEAREQKAMMEQQFAQQREQMEQQLAQQKEQMERQLAQHEKIIQLLGEKKAKG